MEKGKEKGRKKREKEGESDRVRKEAGKGE